jgi:hypothetical protein
VDPIVDTRFLDEYTIPSPVLEPRRPTDKKISLLIPNLGNLRSRHFSML